MFTRFSEGRGMWGAYEIAICGRIRTALEAALLRYMPGPGQYQELGVGYFWDMCQHVLKPTSTALPTTLHGREAYKSRKACHSRCRKKWTVMSLALRSLSRGRTLEACSVGVVVEDSSLHAGTCFQSILVRRRFRSCISKEFEFWAEISLFTSFQHTCTMVSVQFNDPRPHNVPMVLTASCVTDCAQDTFILPATALAKAIQAHVLAFAIMSLSRPRVGGK